MATATLNKRTKSYPSYGVGHGSKPHVATPASLDEFLRAYRISRHRYETVVEHYLGAKAEFPRRKV